VVTDRDRSVVQWVAVIGAVSAQDVMARFGVGRTVGYRRLRALVDHGLLSRARLVYGQPALYVATREGLTWAAMPQVDPLGVGFATTRDWATCARLAVVLERGERLEVWGEPRLRAAELETDRPIASAPMGSLADGRPRLGRPDLVLSPRYGTGCCRRRAVGRRRPPAGGDLPLLGARPDRLGDPLLPAAACGACGFPCRFGVHGHDAIRILSLEEGALRSTRKRFLNGGSAGLLARHGSAPPVRRASVTGAAAGHGRPPLA
jgi:hypothetical protein